MERDDGEERQGIMESILYAMTKGKVSEVTCELGRHGGTEARKEGAHGEWERKGRGDLLRVFGEGRCCLYINI